MSRYTDRVEYNLKGCEAVSTGVCPGCDECREVDDRFTVREVDGEEGCGGFYTFKANPGPAFDSEDAAEAASKEAHKEAWSSGDLYDEPSFSWRECGICGSRLGGERSTWHYIADGRIWHHNDACTDCVLYLANGDEPTGPEWAEEVEE